MIGTNKARVTQKAESLCGDKHVYTATLTLLDDPKTTLNVTTFNSHVVARLQVGAVVDVTFSLPGMCS